MSHYLILVIGEYTNLRLSIALMLRRMGYFVTATGRVDKGLNHLESGGYDLVILDIDSTEISQAFLPKINNDHPNLALLILANRPLSESEKNPFTLDAQYLAKPVPPELLLDHVGIALGKEYRIPRQ